MASSTNTFGNNTCTLSSRPAVSRPSRSSRVVPCNASKQPNETALKIAGAAAAAQLAILPFAGGAMANPQFDLAFGEDLQAQARASDAKTSAEPTLGDVGRSLQGQFGQKDATDVGKAVKDNTPSGSDIKGAADKLGRKIDQATPDLSGVFDGLLDQGKSAAKDVKDAAKGKADDAKDAGGDINAAAKRVVGQSESISKTLDNKVSK